MFFTDKGCADGREEIAKSFGALVISSGEDCGSGLKGLAEHSRGTLLTMGETDDSFDFRRLDGFVQRVLAGDGRVMGNCFEDEIASGALQPPPTHLGNLVLSWLGSTLARSPIKDFQSCLSGINRQSLRVLDLQATSVEFESEVLVESGLGGSRVGEVPSHLSKVRQGGPPHLRSWRGGGCQLRFVLIVSPRLLFLILRTAAFVPGFIGLMLLSLKPVGITDSSQLYLAVLSVVGYQSVLVVFPPSIYVQQEGLRIPRSSNLDRMQKSISLDGDAFVGLFFLYIGLKIALAKLLGWALSWCGLRDAGATVRAANAVVLLMILGAQTSMAGRFLGVPSVRMERS